MYCTCCVCRVLYDKKTVYNINVGIVSIIETNHAVFSVDFEHLHFEHLDLCLNLNNYFVYNINCI